MEKISSHRKPKSETNFDVEEGLKHYLPNLLKLIEGEFRWKQLNKLWKRQFDKNVEQSKGQKIKYGINIFQLTVLAEKGDKDSIRWVQTLDQICIDLNNLLSIDEKKHLKENLFDFLRYTEDFKNYLGEFLILIFLIRTANYKFVQTEVGTTKGGATIDFKLLNTTNNNFEYFEVINFEMHPKHFVNNETTELFLKSKLEDKLAAKDKSGLVYILIPVVWMDFECTSKLVKFYKETGFNIPRVFPPFVYHRFDDKKDGIQYEKFSTIFQAYTLEGL